MTSENPHIENIEHATVIGAAEITAVAKIAQEALRPEHIKITEDNLLFIPASAGKPSEVIDLDKIRAPLVPRRKTGTIKVFSVQAFNTILNHNKDAGDIVIYLDANALTPSITAVLNDHGDHGPGHRDFRCSIEFRPTVEWAKWKKIDGRMLPQADFAEFIEENLNDIVDPPGANMLEIVTFLQATRSVDFKSALNLSNGQVQFQNIESLDAKVSASALNVPTEFTLGIAPIQGSPLYKIPAKFRYRLSDGKLTLGLKLLRTEDVLNQIFDGIVSDIVLGEGITQVYGTP